MDHLLKNVVPFLVATLGSSRINPGEFLRIFTVALLLVIALAGGYNPTGQSLTLN